MKSVVFCLKTHSKNPLVLDLAVYDVLIISIAQNYYIYRPPDKSAYLKIIFQTNMYIYIYIVGTQKKRLNNMCSD